MQVNLALSPEPGLLTRISLGQAPFLQTLRRTRSPSLFVRVLQRYYGLVRLPAVVHHGCTFIFDHADHANWAWPTTGSPGFRARSFSTCMGSATTWSLDTSCTSRCVQCCLPNCPKPSALQRIYFRGSIPSPYLPLSTLATSPCGQTAMTRRPVWFATPSLQGTCTLDFLPACTGASGHHTKLLCFPSFPFFFVSP